MSSTVNFRMNISHLLHSSKTPEIQKNTNSMQRKACQHACVCAMHASELAFTFISDNHPSMLAFSTPLLFIHAFGACVLFSFCVSTRFSFLSTAVDAKQQPFSEKFGRQFVDGAVRHPHAKAIVFFRQRLFSYKKPITFSILSFLCPIKINFSIEYEKELSACFRSHNISIRKS